MTSVINDILLRELTDTYKSAEGVVVISMAGLSMAENEGLRKALRKEVGVRLRVVPNKIAHRALKDCGLDFARDAFRGANIGVMAGTAEQTIGAAKVVAKHEITKKGKVALRGGALEGNVLGAKDTAALADVPDKNTLRAKMLACIIGPASGLARVLNANTAAVARVIQAHADQAPAGETPAS
jgi:large subunit ribosomal protein L10